MAPRKLQCLLINTSLVKTKCTKKVWSKKVKELKILEASEFWNPAPKSREKLTWAGFQSRRTDADGSNIRISTSERSWSCAAHMTLHDANAAFKWPKFDLKWRFFATLYKKVKTYLSGCTFFYLIQHFCLPIPGLRVQLHDLGKAPYNVCC